jgi:sulfate transport system substrate-binding protein
VNILVDAGLIDRSWDKQAYKGIEADTVVVFAVRNGNPKHIRGWADLVKPGVQVVTPNPFSSGSAKWNILAAYGAQRRLGKSDAQAQAYVKKLFQHVVSQDTSGRNATNTFLSGKGDALLTYESEALTSRAAGTDIQYVIPRQTMLIELPIAELKSSANKDLANRFIRFTKGPVAQDLFGQYGWRPVNPTVAKKYAEKYPSRPGIFKIDDRIFGGWRTVDKKWFSQNGIMVKIERGVGGPTSG